MLMEHTTRPVKCSTDVFFILIDITECFKNPKFQNEASSIFQEITLFLTYGGEKTTLEWSKLVLEAIFPTDRGYFCKDFCWARCA